MCSELASNGAFQGIDGCTRSKTLMRKRWPEPFHDTRGTGRRWTLACVSLDQPVQRQGCVEKGPGLVCSYDGQSLPIQETNLYKQGCLVPVDVFVGYFPVLKLHHHDNGQLDMLACWRHAGQHESHLQIVGEAEQ